MATKQTQDPTPALDRIVLKIDKMSRLFFFSENRYLSISVPLTVMVSSDNIPVFQYGDKEVDAEIISWLLMIAKNNDDVLSDDDYITFEMECDERNFDFISLRRLIDDADYGYIRYDVDPAGFKNARNNGKPHLHPLFHCDVHLSNSATFKIGCMKSVSPAQFIDLLDNTKDRWYAIPASETSKFNFLK